MIGLQWFNASWEKEASWWWCRSVPVGDDVMGETTVDNFVRLTNNSGDVVMAYGEGLVHLLGGSKKILMCLGKGQRAVDLYIKRSLGLGHDWSMLTVYVARGDGVYATNWSLDRQSPSTEIYYTVKHATDTLKALGMCRRRTKEIMLTWLEHVWRDTMPSNTYKILREYIERICSEEDYE
jgi:hypothetical protein